MSAVYLDHVHLKRESKSFVDSLYAILTAADLFNGTKYMLSGLTGMAFKFTVHERLLPLSVSAYGNWVDEHAPALDNIGLHAEQDAGRTRHPTFQYYQQQAIEWIKQTLNQGIGVIYWIPEFGVIRGYDDQDEVFYVQDGLSLEDHIVLYDNLGLNMTEFWYVGVIDARIEVSLEKMVLESVRLALEDWNTPHKTLPNKDIASGRLAYTFLIQALRSGSFDEQGARYIMSSYLYSRQEIKQYLHDVRYLWPQLEAAYAAYDQLVTGMAGWDMHNQPELIAKLERAAELEESAMTQFRLLSALFPDPSRETVRRWGRSTAR
ncbi:hypothetical protein [Paenibacillus sp. GCM10027626]|uniref:hypothetical protein n=1 Tax=Paenibacillus sp. GCM10027626 TaxID=3273411 RepID=UPI0036298463